MTNTTCRLAERNVASLSPYPRNARTHSKKQVRQIASSIERFGFTNPVLISDDGEIIAGHGRVEAAKLLGWKAVPNIALSHLSDTERRAYVLADNKLAMNAGWDKDILAIELQALDEREIRGWDERLARRDEAQVEVNYYAEKYARAKSPERKHTLRQDWHFEQRIFDIINDRLPARYKAKLENRSYAEGASRQGKALRSLCAIDKKIDPNGFMGTLLRAADRAFEPNQPHVSYAPHPSHPTTFGAPP